MKKIIAIVAVVTTITACFCIGANATSGITIQDGTKITFKNEINLDYGDTENHRLNINFINNGTEYNRITITYNAVTPPYRALNYDSIMVYDGRTNQWAGNSFKTISINGTQTITDNDFIEWLYNNTVSGMPENPLGKTINNTKATFATTLTAATAIIAWLMANQIALVGLYMYILIALVATGKRFITGV